MPIRASLPSPLDETFIFYLKEERKMSISERKREIARRRKRRKESRKLRAKGILPPAGEAQETERKRPRKASESPAA
jgi:hypothetical protein